MLARPKPVRQAVYRDPPLAPLGGVLSIPAGPRRTPRRERVLALLRQGKAPAEVVTLTGESVEYVARVDRDVQAVLEAIVTAVGGKTGAVEVTRIPNMEGKAGLLLISPASGPKSDFRRFIECLSEML